MTSVPRAAVIGIDGRPLVAAAQQRLSEATLIAGAARHLQAYETCAPADARCLALGDVGAAVAEIAAHAGRAVVLASGDPGFFGVVRVLQQAGVCCEVFPAVSSLAALASLVGLTWDDATVVSAHGRADGLRRAVNACRALPKVAVLTGPDAGPAEIGAGLAGRGHRLLVGEQLGGAAQTLTRCTPEEATARSWAEPNVVLVLGSGSGTSAAPTTIHPRRSTPTEWALDEKAFDHRDGMVTKREVRALALAHLGPGIGDHIWDVGAGSGSVSIECARFGAAVTAVERDPEQCRRIAANAAAHHVAIDVVTGEAPDKLSGIAEPDGVFVGGGGADVAAIVAAARDRDPQAIVVTLAALERVGPVLELLRAGGYATDGVQLSAARLAALPGEATRLAAQNPVFVAWGKR